MFINILEIEGNSEWLKSVYVLTVLFYSNALYMVCFSTLIAVIVINLTRLKHQRALPWFIKKQLDGKFGEILLLQHVNDSEVCIVLSDEKKKTFTEVGNRWKFWLFSIFFRLSHSHVHLSFVNHHLGNMITCQMMNNRSFNNVAVAKIHWKLITWNWLQPLIE